jgi:hypothetical protein
VTKNYHVVFDGFPSPEGPRFVELEDDAGCSISAGEWRKRDDGLTELVLPAPDAASIELWAAVSPEGDIDLDRLCHSKRDCRISAAEKRSGWTVQLILLTTAAAQTGKVIHGEANPIQR